MKKKEMSASIDVKKKVVIFMSSPQKHPEKSSRVMHNIFVLKNNDVELLPNFIQKPEINVCNFITVITPRRHFGLG
jgi:hypothetical protein